MKGNKIMLIIALIAAISVFAPQANAQTVNEIPAAPNQQLKEKQQYGTCIPKDDYYKDKERGWYHNEHCLAPKPEEKKDEVKLKKAPSEETAEIDWKKVVDPKYLESITAEEFRKLLDKVKDEAVYKPTEEKLLVYMTLQDHARKKSVEFAYIWRDVLLKNPILDITATYPAHNYGGFAIAREQRNASKSGMEELRERAAILLFVSAECPYCHDQMRAMENLVREYGITYKTYSRDNCPSNFNNCIINPELFDQFNIQTTPAIIAVYRNNEDKPVFQPISNGLTVSDEIVQRLIFYHNYIKTGQHPTI